VRLPGAPVERDGRYFWVANEYGPDISSWHTVGSLVVSGLGFGLSLAPMVDAILTARGHRGRRISVRDPETIQQVGLALGVALVGVLFFTQLDNDSDQWPGGRRIRWSTTWSRPPWRMPPTLPSRPRRDDGSGAAP
jgi:hypothetical protein